MYFIYLYLIILIIYCMYMFFEESLSYYVELIIKEFDFNVFIIKLLLFCLYEN